MAHARPATTWPNARQVTHRGRDTRGRGLASTTVHQERVTEQKCSKRVLAETTGLQCVCFRKFEQRESGTGKEQKEGPSWHGQIHSGTTTAAPAAPVWIVRLIIILRHLATMVTPQSRVVLSWHARRLAQGLRLARRTYDQRRTWSPVALATRRAQRKKRV